MQKLPSKSPRGSSLSAAIPVLLEPSRRWLEAMALRLSLTSGLEFSAVRAFAVRPAIRGRHLLVGIMGDGNRMRPCVVVLLHLLSHRTQRSPRPFPREAPCARPVPAAPVVSNLLEPRHFEGCCPLIDDVSVPSWRGTLPFDSLPGSPRPRLCYLRPS